MRFGLWLNRAMRLFDHLPVNLRERLIHMATELHVPAGHTLIRRGERSDDMYRILQGRLEVVDSRSQVVLEVMGQGQVVGEMSFVTEEARSADVRSGEDTRVLVWRGLDLQQAMQNDPEFGAAMYKAFANLLADRLRNTTGYAVTRTSTDAVAFSTVSDDLGRSARELADELKRSLFEAEDRLKVEPDGPAVEAVAGALGSFIQKGHRLFASLSFEEAEGAGEILYREMHPFLSSTQTSDFQQACGESGLGLALFLAHLQGGVSGGTSEVGRALDSAILQCSTPKALVAREATLVKAALENIALGGERRVLVSPSHHGALVSQLAYKLGYDGGEIVYMDQDPAALRAADNGMAIRPKKVSYRPVRGSVYTYFEEAARSSIGDFDLVILHGLLDFLPTRLLPDLADSLAGLLREDGEALLVQLSPTEDEFFFTHLIGWRTIRRTPKQVQRLLESSTKLRVETAWEGKAGSLLRVKIA